VGDEGREKGNHNFQVKIPMKDYKKKLKREKKKGGS